MYPVIRSLLFRMQPESAHDITMKLLSSLPGSAKWFTTTNSLPESLKQTIWGLPFHHPIGLAAGLDKNGVAVDGLFNCGFSFVEVGTVTPRPQPGNPKPRMFRLVEDEALINRMGFNNHGAEALYDSLRKHQRNGVVGVNIGKNKVTPNESAVDDYLTCLETLFETANYIVINVSSPNTPGLRDLQDEEAVLPLAKAVLSKRDELTKKTEGLGKQHHPPVLLKLAPDLADEAIDAMGKRLMDAGIDGFIATNTTIRRDSLKSPHKGETGGLSGKPLQQRSTEVIRILYKATNGRIPIIGSGGVFTAADAYEKLKAGASLVQVYTGFIYRGPGLVQELVTGIATKLKADGYSTIQDVIGQSS